MTADCSFNRALRAFYKATNLHTHTLSIMGKVFFFPWRSKQSFFTLFSSSQFYFNLALDVLPQTAHVYFYSRKQVHTHSLARPRRQNRTQRLTQRANRGYFCARLLFRFLAAKNLSEVSPKAKRLGPAARHRRSESSQPHRAALPSRRI